MAADDHGQTPQPKSFIRRLKENMPSDGIGVVLIGLFLLALIFISWYMSGNSSSTVDGARGVLAIVFSLATITLAFSLMLGAFLTTTKEDAKERFTLGMQVLT